MTEHKAEGRIVVGVDGSDSSIAALREAQRLAAATGSKVDAVACWSVPNVAVLPYALGTIDFEGGARQVLAESLVRAFGDDLPTTVSSRLIHGHPRPALIEASDGADMLVVGRRGHGGFVGLLLGSVSSACVAHAHCPVLVIHDSVEASTVDDGS